MYSLLILQLKAHLVCNLNCCCNFQLRGGLGLLAIKKDTHIIYPANLLPTSPRVFTHAQWQKADRYRGNQADKVRLQ